MIFIDSNIPMYLIGAAHPHKIDAQRLVERLITEGQKFVTDAEVFQEILHRYAAIRRHDAIQPAFSLLLGLVDEVFPVDILIAQRAKEIVLDMGRLSPRDAIHLASMESMKVDRLLSFDRGYDSYPGIERLGR